MAKPGKCSIPPPYQEGVGAWWVRVQVGDAGSVLADTCLHASARMSMCMSTHVSINMSIHIAMRMPA